jgi:mannose-6-phosphate isomerase-like protein (cupin superfamily)
VGHCRPDEWHSSFLEQWITADGNPPPHIHTHEDEAFLVIDGEIDVTVGETTISMLPPPA